MTSSKRTSESRHPIQVAARRSGLSPEVLRIWEKRYVAVSPARTASGRRLYSDADLERLRLLHTVIQGGRRIGEVSKLSTEELSRLVEEDHQGHLKAPIPSGVTSPRFHNYHQQSLEMVADLDGAGLETTLSRALVALDSVTFLEQVVSPIAVTLGERWADGSLGTYHEHFATPIIRNILAGMIAAGPHREGNPVIVVATPTGQLHELGAMMAAALAASQGWHSIYLGADLPAPEIANAAIQRSATLVALSMIFPGDDKELVVQLRELRRQLPRDIRILAGGSATQELEGILRETGIVRLLSIHDFGAILQSHHERS